MEHLTVRKIFVFARLFYVLCFMFYVLCFMFQVLCFIFSKYVPCKNRLSIAFHDNRAVFVGTEDFRAELGQTRDDFRVRMPVAILGAYRKNNGGGACVAKKDVGS